jgi:hypothetical protein
MKTIKFLLPVAAMFVSAIAFGQKSNQNRMEKQNAKAYHSSTDRRETARVNGAVNANEHANANAQRNANENSVLNGTTTTTKTKYKVKNKRTDADKRKYGNKKKD